MSGSTGSVGRVIGAPPSAIVEQARLSQQDTAGFPGLLDGVRQVNATIKEVHPEKPLIKAFADDGVPVANGNWIPLNHSPADIAERWGKLRTGLRILANYSGPSGTGANATIVGEEDEIEGSGLQIENDIAEGLYYIFSPGSSVV